MRMSRLPVRSLQMRLEVGLWRLWRLRWLLPLLVTLRLVVDATF